MRHPSLHRFARKLLTLPATLVLASLAYAQHPSTLGHDSAPEGPQELVPWTLSPQGIKIFGCKASLSISSLKKCIERAVAKKISDATAKVKSDLEKKAKAAASEASRKLAAANALAKRYQRDLAAAKKAAADASRTLASVKSQLRNTSAKLRSAVRDKAAAVARANTLQKAVDALNAKLSRYAGVVVVNVKWQKELVSALKALPLANLFGCLQSQVVAGNMRFPTLVSQFAKDPVGVIHTIADENIDRIGRTLPSVLRSEFGALVQRGKLPSDREVVATVMRLVDVAVGPTGAGSCVFREVRPKLNQAALKAVQRSRRAVQKMRARAEKTIRDELIPLVMKKATTALAQVFDQQIEAARSGKTAHLPPEIEALILTVDELQAVTRHVLFKRKIRERFATANFSIQNLLDPETAGAAVQTHLDDLRKLTEGTEDFEALYIEIAAEVLRKVGHKWIASDVRGHGGHLLTQATGFLKIGQDTTSNVVQGVCGLIPEVGAAAAGVVWTMVDVLWNQAAVPALITFAKKQMTKGVNDLADTARDRITSKADMDELGGVAGKLGTVLSMIPHEQLLGVWTGDVLKDEMEMLDEHFKLVSDLAAGKKTN